MSRRLPGLTVVAVLVLAVTQVMGAQPHIVVAVRSPGEVVRDVRYLAKVIGGPLGAGLSARLTAAAEKSGLADVVADDRPCGVYLRFAPEGGILAPVAYVPVRSAEAVERFLEKRLHARVEEVTREIVRVVVDDDVAYLRIADGYAVVSPVPGTLEDLPELSSLQPSRDFEIVVYASEIPESVRTAIVDRCVAEMQAHAAKLARKHRELAELIEYRIETSTRLIRELSEQIETIRISLWTDRERGVVGGEVAITALPDSELAMRIADSGRSLSRYSALATGALAFVHVATPIPDACLEAAARNIEITSDVAAEVLSRRGVRVSPGLLARAMETTIANGSINYFFRVDVFDNQPHVAGAIRVESTEPILELIERYEAAGKVSVRNVGEFQGGRILELKAHVPQKEGKEITVYILATEQEFWAAVGENGLEYLKKLAQRGRDAEVQEVPPVSIKIDLKQVAQAIARQDKRKDVAAAAEAALEAFGDKDVSLNVKVFTSGRSIVASAETDAITLAGVIAGAIAHRAAHDHKDHPRKEHEEH